MAFSLGTLFSSLKSSVHPSHSAVGIDLGSSSVKVTEIEATEQALTLRTYGELQLGPYASAALGDTVKLEQQKRIESIVDVIREAGVTTNTGVLAIPMAVSFMTVIPVATQNGDDLGSKVAVEARKYIPMPLAEVAFDWTELSATGTGENLREVLVAAIEHTTVREYTDVLEGVGMASQPSEIEIFSLIRALSRNDDTTVAFIDLGAQTAKLAITRGGTIERIHRVVAGGALISDRIAEARNISFEEAENLKRTYTSDAEYATDVRKATTTVLDAPFQEFKRIIDQYESRIGEPIKRTVLAGGVSAYADITALTRDALGREVEVGNPFDKLAYPAFMEETLTHIAPSFAVSTGAALRYFAN